eukprot:Sspe_Gene.56732::Locus_31191_Transcript_1_1_Confidence_1.000_Length_1428::g.56732::m.56732
MFSTIRRMLSSERKSSTSTNASDESKSSWGETITTSYDSDADSEATTDEESPKAPSIDTLIHRAYQVLHEHIAIIVASYCSPEVFSRFLDTELDEDMAMCIRQMMRGISMTLSSSAKQDFGDVILGRREESDECEHWAVRTGGLLHGDRELLMEFLRENEAFAEYVGLTRNNPFIQSALSAATEAWRAQHDLEDEAEEVVPEPNFDRIVVHNGKIHVRGSALPALSKNMEKYVFSECHQVAQLHESVVIALQEVIVTPSQMPFFMWRSYNIENQQLEELAVAISKQGVVKLASSDPQASPSKLLHRLWNILRSMANELCTGAGETPVQLDFHNAAITDIFHPWGSEANALLWPGSKAKRLKDSLEKAMKSVLLLRNRILFRKNSHRRQSEASQDLSPRAVATS